MRIVWTQFRRKGRSTLGDAHLVVTSYHYRTGSREEVTLCEREVSGSSVANVWRKTSEIPRDAHVCTRCHKRLSELL